MKKIIINGKEITTNLGGNYSFSDGESATMTCEVKLSASESDEDFVKRLAEKGYTRITLKYGTTCVRGYYNTFAMCK